MKVVSRLSVYTALSASEVKAALFLFTAAAVGFAYSLFGVESRRAEQLQQLYNAADSVATALDSIYIGQDSSEQLSVAADSTQPCININTASALQLQQLPRIGPKMAQRIIAWREQQPFLIIDEIKRVRGIGEKTFANMASRICVDEETKP